MSYSFADVVLVAFPFTDQRRAKQRPATVISSEGYNGSRPDVILMAITSQARCPLTFGEAKIEHWQAAGLLKVSVIKPIIFTAETAIIRKTLGRLHDDDKNRLGHVIRQVIAG